MSKFTSVMENHLNSTDLLRIRIKHDPRSEEGTSPDYVGYVLEEDGVGNILAIVPDLGGDPMEFSSDQYETCGSDVSDTLTGLKEYIIKYMLERGYHEKVKQITKFLLQAKNSSDIEAILCKCGCNSEGGLLEIYRGFIDRE